MRPTIVVPAVVVHLKQRKEKNADHHAPCNEGDLGVAKFSQIYRRGVPALRPLSHVPEVV